MTGSIGEIIRESVKKSGLTQEEFAKEMGMTLRNVANLFNKSRLPIDQIVRASRILNENFIKHYTDILYEEEPGLAVFKQDEPILHEDQRRHEAIVHKEPEMTFTLCIRGAADKISEQIPSLINIIKLETEARGLHLG